jgi:hypothetical protein
MAKYAIIGSQATVSGSYKTVLDVFATTGALRRGKIYDVLIGTNGTPADNYLQWDISRMTADGTGTAVTPQALDPADVAALATAKNNYSAEPTITASSSLFNVGVNQRASYRAVRVLDRIFTEIACLQPQFKLGSCIRHNYAGRSPGERLHYVCQLSLVLLTLHCEPNRRHASN